MVEHPLTFVASQIQEQIAFRGNPSKFEPCDAAWWSMPSFKNNGERKLSAMEKDGGHWRGQVNILPDGTLNMLATWYPVADGHDSVQFAGPIVMGMTCHVSIVGGPENTPVPGEKRRRPWPSPTKTRRFTSTRSHSPHRLSGGIKIGPGR